MSREQKQAAAASPAPPASGAQEVPRSESQLFLERLELLRDTMKLSADTLRLVVEQLAGERQDPVRPALKHAFARAEGFFPNAMKALEEAEGYAKAIGESAIRIRETF